jgi:hypothetical protein
LFTISTEFTNSVNIITIVRKTSEWAEKLVHCLREGLVP